MAVTGYKLRINGGSFVDHEIDVGYIFSYLLEDLAPATEYSVEVQAYDELGVESDWSSAVSATTASPMMIIDSGGSALIDADGNALITYQ